MLKAQCRGPPAPNGGNAHRLRKLLDGVHPRSGVHLGPPQAIEVALDTFSVILGAGGPTEAPQLMSCPLISASASPMFWPRFSEVDGR